MKQQSLGFSITELVIVMAIFVIVLAFGFSKISSYYREDITLSNIESLYREIVNFKIVSHLNQGESKLVFHKDFPYWYVKTLNQYESPYEIFVASGSVSGENIGISLSILSDDTFVATGMIITGENRVYTPITVQNSISTDVIKIANKDIKSTQLRLIGSGGMNISSTLSIFALHTSDTLKINSIKGIDFNNNQRDLKMFYYINNKNYKNRLFGQDLVETNILLKYVTISFVDEYNNTGYLELK